MNRNIYIIMFCLIMLSFISCETEDIKQPINDNDAIALELYTGVMGTRAEIEDEDYEYALSHLDVFIFKDVKTDGNNNGSTDDEKSLFHYERVATSAAPTGKVYLRGKKRDEYGTDDYWVYVIANSSINQSVFVKDSDTDENYVRSLADLKKKTQTDLYIYLSALKGLDVSVPEYFLMDGIAYSGNDELNLSGEYDPVKLYDGIPGNSTTLKVNLRRAAAKVVVELTAGKNVELISNNKEGYYLRNIPTKTYLLAEAGEFDYEEETMPIGGKTVSKYSVWDIKNTDWTTDVQTDNDKVTITTYVYSHRWNKDMLAYLNKGTSLVINIPLKYDSDLESDENEVTTHEDSYYQIELGVLNKNDNDIEEDDFRELRRNHYYKIIGTINAPGAEDTAEPEELEELRFYAIDWEEVDVDVSGETPAYLKVNKDTLRIYNQNIDESLVFASSSPITLKILDNNNPPTPYFVNKFGVETYVSPEVYQMSAVDLTKGGLAGSIQVNSNKPENNAVRYFTLEVTNQDGKKEEVFVEQYPVIYITNVLGFYSYRSDFKSSGGQVTTYEERNDPYYTATSWDSNSESWNHSIGRNGFFVSKVNTYTHTAAGNYKGKSNLDYYEWAHYVRYGGSWVVEGLENVKTTKYKKYNDEEAGNARMYHVHVTATSDDYTVGRPRLDVNGYPVNTADNSRLVSPSFMIASQLGATSNPVSYLQAVTHCANYVETYKKVVYDDNGNPILVPNNGNNTGEVVHLSDWRLPTAAEVEIIMQFQYGTGNDAMDEVLAGDYYYCVNPPDNKVKNPQKTGNGVYVRCVRDAY